MSMSMVNDVPSCELQTRASSSQVLPEQPLVLRKMPGLLFFGCFSFLLTASLHHRSACRLDIPRCSVEEIECDGRRSTGARWQPASLLHV